MKQNQHIQKASRGFHLPWLEEYIMKEHQKCKQDTVMYAGELALKNKPAQHDRDISPFITWIQSKYHQLESYAVTNIQAANEKELGKFEVTLSEQNKVIINERITEIELKLHRLRGVQSSIELDFPWRKKFKSDIIIAAIAGVESLLSLKAFQLFGDSFIFTILIAITLGMALWGAAHTVPHLIRQGKTLSQRIIISSIISCITLSAFYGLGILRSIYFHEKGGLDIHPALFTLLNTFFFGVATTYAYFFLPTKQDEVDKEKHDDLQKEILGLEKEKKELVDTLDNMPGKLTTSLSERLNKMTYQSDMKGWIANLCQETIGAFIRENISVRRDNVTPECFQNISNEKMNSYSLNP